MGKKTEIVCNLREDGTLPRGASAQLVESLERLAGKGVVITVERKRNVRSGQQNKYYWGVIVNELRSAIEDAWGVEVSKETAHEMLKNECNYEEICDRITGEIRLDKKGKAVRIPKSTTELTTTEAEEYYERCRRFLLESFNWKVPLPNEQKSAF